MPKLNVQLAIISAVVGLGFLGIALPYPVIPSLLLPSKNTLNTFLFSSWPKPILLGLVLSCYPLGQFIGSPVLGAASDQLGRKIMLVYSLAGTASGYLLSAIAILCHSFEWLLLGRLWTGFCEGNIAIAQSAAADIYETVEKVKSFSWLNGAVALGYIVGPLLGGITVNQKNPSQFNYAAPFLVAMSLAILSLAFVKCFFHDSYQAVSKHKKLGVAGQIISGFPQMISNIGYLFQNGLLKKVIIVYILLYLGIDLFYEFYPFYFVGSWDFSVMEVALFSAAYTLPYAISQAILVPTLGKHFNPLDTLKLTSSMSGLALIIMLIPKSYHALYATLPVLGIFISFCSTNIAVALSDSTDSYSQGKVFGAAQSLRVLNDAITSFAGGILASLVVSMPLVVSSFFMILSALLLCKFNGVSRNKSQ